LPIGSKVNIELGQLQKHHDRKCATVGSKQPQQKLLLKTLNPAIAMQHAQKQRTPGQIRPGVLTLTIGAHTDWVPIDQIVRVEGAGNYSRIHTQSGDVYLTAVILRLMEQRLPDFWRVHKSHLVNPDYVDRIRRTEGLGRYVLLTNGGTVPVARRMIITLIPQLNEKSTDVAPFHLTKGVE
jgi:two-component system LytT family response regulator